MDIFVALDCKTCTWKFFTWSLFFKNQFSFILGTHFFNTWWYFKPFSILDFIIHLISPEDIMVLKYGHNWWCIAWPGIRTFMMYNVLIPQKIMRDKKSTLSTFMIYWVEMNMLASHECSLSVLHIKNGSSCQARKMKGIIIVRYEIAKLA